MVKRVLIVKLSSLGDVLHTLPALEEAHRAHPEIQFDWVLEESLAQIPTWHAAVHRVIPIALRRWRRQGWAAWRSGEMIAFVQKLQERQYDLILDAQGLMKSAGVARLARGAVRIGLDRHSAREGLASIFYHRAIAVPKIQHAIERIRQLFAQALNYPYEPRAPLHYGIDPARLSPMTLPPHYVVFLHGTTWPSKHWPEVYWAELAALVKASGLTVVVLWGTEEERLRAERLAQAGAMVLPTLSLSQIATVLRKAQACVAVDTGLGHLAAAVERPLISLYGPTSPSLTGALGPASEHWAATLPCVPCLKRGCKIAPREPEAPCMRQLTPRQVHQRLQALGRELR